MSVRDLKSDMMQLLRTGWRDGIERRVASRFYQVAYFRSLLRRRVAQITRRKAPVVYDAVCVRPPGGDREWILERVCQEVARHFPGTCHIAYDWKLPVANAYFFSHYAYLFEALKRNHHLWGRVLAPLYTHPKPIEGVGKHEFLFAMRQATTIVSMCSLSSEHLASLGVPRSKIRTVLMGADPEMFAPHVRGGGAVGFCCGYYPRKNPERIGQIVAAMPHRQFILLGRNWDQYPGFGKLLALPNFEYREAPYSEYPKFYSALDVFVSASTLEGGPIPLIEAMMANVVPVASRTGFAPDVIRHGENGFIFDVDAGVQTICALIDRAFHLKGDIHASVQHLTWRRFALEVAGYLLNSQETV